jgi:saccharopine dehydrogenase (NAD+, L-lysine-forming)
MSDSEGSAINNESRSLTSKGGHTNERIPVVVYGATGYTGRLVCAELIRHKTPFAVAGRDGAKLRAFVGKLGQPIDTVVAPLDDRAALERMAGAARVVLDCAGPFVRMGRPVQDAALAAGSHFLDITGEHPWMRATYERDAEARARGVALINAVGFDVVPTDAAAVLAAEAAGGKPARVRIAFATLGGRATQGTTRSALEAAHLGGIAWVDGQWRTEPVASQRWEVPFAPPLGPRTCISVPWGDVATAPRSTGAREVRTFVLVPRQVARVARVMAPFGKLMAVKPIAALGERLIQRLPEGPSDEERARGSFSVYAEADGAKGTRGVWVTGPEGYTFTAAAAALCARWAAEPSFTAKGALTPAEAFGAAKLLDALAPSGVRWGAAA